MDFDFDDLCVDQPHFLDYTAEETTTTSSSNSADKNGAFVYTGTRRKKTLSGGGGEREHHSLGREPMSRVTEFDDLKYERKHSLDRERGRKVMVSSFLDQRESPSTSSHVCGTWPADRPSDLHPVLSSTSQPPGGVCELGPKVECVYSLLSMLGSHDAVEMSSKFLELSRTPETCATLRRSGCIPLLVQMIHSDSDEVARKNASIALHNVVLCHPDDKAGRREVKVLRLIEHVMEYCNFLKTLKQSGEAVADDTERHPSQAISSLMKISFDEEHRHAMCQLGALQTIANLVHLDHAAHGAKSTDPRCISLRRYAGMALTNLTFGDGNNKALLCSNKDFMRALVAQLDSSADDLLQVSSNFECKILIKDIISHIGDFSDIGNFFYFSTFMYFLNPIYLTRFVLEIVNNFRFSIYSQDLL